ncbi:MAG: hypothetical protein IJQ13_03310 [Prevotella sp.]|nr:hypothetical protein [Prevotella sp.]
MKTRILLSVCLLTASLTGDAKVNLPDSLLTIRKSEYYMISSPDTAQAILRGIRERQLEPEWRVDFAEGDLNYNMRCFLKALPFYRRVKTDPAVSDSTQVQLRVLKRLADCYYALYNDDELVETIVALGNKAKACGDKAFESMSIFLSGKSHHYHGHKDMGYSSCLQALEMMRESEFPMKHVELRNYYADLLKMYTRDGRYDEAMHMSQYQEAEALFPSPFVIHQARERGLRQVYALRASMLAHAGRMEEADGAYAAWKKTTGGNAIDDMDIFDYLELSRHNDEAHDVISRYRRFIAEQGDSVSYRMLFALNRDALLLINMGEHEQAAAYGRQVAAIAQQLHIRKSGTQMQTTYELLMEQSGSHRKSLWLITLSVAVYL